MKFGHCYESDIVNSVYVAEPRILTERNFVRLEKSAGRKSSNRAAR